MLEAEPASTVLDVGTGSGILGLLLARAGCSVVGLDAIAEWQPRATESAQMSGLSSRFAFELADIRTWAGPVFDLVVSNPPYFTVGTGFLPPDPLRAAARHTLRGDLQELIPAMSRHGRRVAVVLPVSREAEARTLLGQCDRPVVRSLVLAPRLVLLEGAGGGGSEAAEHDQLRELDAPSPRVRQLYRQAGVPLERKESGGLPPNAIQARDAPNSLEDGGAAVEPPRSER